MSTVEVEWKGEERDLEKALDEFMEYWSEQDIVIDSIEPDGYGYLMIEVSSDNVKEQHKWLVEGTSNAEGLLDFLDDWGRVNNWRYI
jgi:hypothetical protein